MLKNLTEKMHLLAKKLCSRLKRILLGNSRSVLFGALHFFGIPRRYLKFTLKLQRNLRVNFSVDPSGKKCILPNAFFGLILPIVIFAAISFAACSYKTINYEEVKRQLLGINPADGISKEEAVVLARKYFLEKGYGKRWSILSPYAYYYQPSKEWFVEFGAKYYFFSEGRYRYTLRIIVTDLGRIRGEAFCRY